MDMESMKAFVYKNQWVIELGSIDEKN